MRAKEPWNEIKTISKKMDKRMLFQALLFSLNLILSQIDFLSYHIKYFFRVAIAKPIGFKILFQILFPKSFFINQYAKQMKAKTVT